MHWRKAVVSDVRPLEDGDVDGAIALIRNASLRELRSESFLKEEFLLMLGLNGENLAEFPQELYPWCNKGIRSWQYPIQFAEFLVHLSEMKIRSYVEIGCRFGGTFIILVEYLRRFMDLEMAVAIDIVRSDIMTEYAGRTVGVTYKIASSRDAETVSYLGSNRWDFAFIDGDHSYEGCVADFNSVRQTTKIIGFHDISSVACPGVVRAWQEIKNVVPRNRLFEAVDQYNDVRERTNNTYLGIGLVNFT
jgi:hypothetical protein